jgi:hypothetical protein
VAISYVSLAIIKSERENQNGCPGTCPPQPFRFYQQRTTSKPEKGENAIDKADSIERRIARNSTSINILEATPCESIFYVKS